MHNTVTQMVSDALFLRWGQNSVGNLIVHSS